MGTIHTRRFKIDWIMERILAAANANRTINEELLISKFCIFHASREVTAREILKLLEGAKKIVRSRGKIWTYDAYKQFGE